MQYIFYETTTTVLHVHAELSFEIKKQRISYPTFEQECKFSLQNFEFYLPSAEQPFHGKYVIVIFIFAING
jgi:hypothetical protein